MYYLTKEREGEEREERREEGYKSRGEEVKMMEGGRWRRKMKGGRGRK